MSDTQAAPRTALELLALGSFRDVSEYEVREALKAVVLEHAALAVRLEAAETLLEANEGRVKKIVDEQLFKQLEAAEARVVAAEDALRLAEQHAHENGTDQWGYDAQGIHGYEPGEPRGCPLCAALDAARAAGAS